jgi:tripartite-type tricarboxylate transporter receptor subunit TctC
MHAPRRRLLIGAAAALAARGAHAAQWPTRPVTVVVPFAPGGPTDFIARLLAVSFGKALGQSIVVSNRPGASGNIGAQAVADGDPDGYTLLHTTIASQSLNPILYPDSRLRPLRDLAPIGTTASLPNVLVVPKAMDVKSVADLVALAKKKPGGLNYATFGPGTSPDILSTLFQKLAGFQGTPVPYKGSSLALTDVISGQVDFLFDNITTCAPQVRAGAVKGLAISSTTRSATLPEIPTMKEVGYPGFDLNFGFSLMAPAGTPAPVIEQLQTAFEQAVADAEYTKGLVARGAEPLVVKRADLAKYLGDAVQRCTAIAKEIGVKAS